jgi:tetratricopeptide (TPR) repeat protein
LLSVGGAFAQEAEPLAEPAASPAPVEETGPAQALDPTPAYVPLERPENDYLDAIDRIESDFGPYATELSDLYMGLGQTLLDSGDYEAARDALNRSIMVMRVNSGPNSPEQTNHLYLIANLETMLGELRSADDILQNIYIINSKYFGEESAEMLPVLERMRQWYSVTRPLNARIAEYEDYERNIALTQEMAELSETVNGLAHPETARAYRLVGEAHFQTARFLSREGSMVILMGGTVQSISDVSMTEQLDQGRKAFRKSLESMLANEATTPVDFAQALANTGDWYLLLGRTGHARSFYSEAYAVLAPEGSDTQLADSLFGQPRPLGLLWPDPHSPEGAPAESLDISMTVSKSGEARRVEVLNPPDDLSEDALDEIRRQVLEIRFRPAIMGGKVVNTEDFIWQYSFQPREQTS